MGDKSDNSNVPLLVQTLNNRLGDISVEVGEYTGLSNTVVSMGPTALSDRKSPDENPQDLVSALQGLIVKAEAIRMNLVDTNTRMRDALVPRK